MSLGMVGRSQGWDTSKTKHYLHEATCSRESQTCRVFRSGITHNTFPPAHRTHAQPRHCQEHASHLGDVCAPLCPRIASRGGRRGGRCPQVPHAAVRPRQVGRDCKIRFLQIPCDGHHQPDSPPCGLAFVRVQVPMPDRINYLLNRQHLARNLRVGNQIGGARRNEFEENEFCSLVPLVEDARPHAGFGAISLPASPRGRRCGGRGGRRHRPGVDVCFRLCVCAVCGKKESRETSNSKIGDD